MTDLAITNRLGINSQLPAHTYFDQTCYQEEQIRIFQHQPKYIGHNLLLPQQGDFYVLPQDEGHVLVHGDNGIELLSNVCRHRQAIMLKDRGNTDLIVCPLHRWTYDLKGELIGAPHFQQKPCLNLNKKPLQSWNGLLFESGNHLTDVQTQLASLKLRELLDFSGYQIGHIEKHHCNYNWKTFIEVYLEDYHVEPFHPGLGKFVSCHDLDWQFDRAFSVQTVGINNFLTQAGSPVYQRWQAQIKQFFGDQLPQFGAVWLTYYPTVMIEFYPGVLTVSTLHPIGPQETLNIVEFYYPEEIALFEPEFMKAQQAAYMETCIEDDEIAERMDAGRRALMNRGENEVGPYQNPMEDGMQHFHEWYRSVMPI